MNILRRIYNAIRPILVKREKLVPVKVPVLTDTLLAGRRVLVTGGSNGIGLAIAKAMVRSGADVIVTGRDENRLNESIKQIRTICRTSRQKVSVFQLDITDITSFPSVLKEFGTFDILVNNAGYVGGGSFGDTKESEYDQVMDTNLKGAYFLSETVSKFWIENGTKGNILNICSASSLRPGQSPYILSKWGLRALTIGMAKSLIKYGIVVNGLAPGCTDTQKFSPDGDLTNLHNPSGRLVTVDEIANMAVILVSPLSRMIVGDVIYMTGGSAITTLDD